MLKYGYNDKEWDEFVEKNAFYSFGSGIVAFNKKSYISMMKRKKVYEEDWKMLEALKDMINRIEEHMKEVENK